MHTVEPSLISDTILADLEGAEWPSTIFLAEASPGKHLILCLRGSNVIEGKHQECHGEHVLAAFASESDTKSALRLCSLAGKPVAKSFDQAYDIAKSKSLPLPSGKTLVLAGVALFASNCAEILALHRIPR